MRIPSLFIQKHVSFVEGEMLTLLAEICRRINQQTSNTVQQIGIDTLWGSELFAVKCALHQNSQEVVNGIATKQDNRGIVAGLLV